MTPEAMRVALAREAGWGEIHTQGNTLCGTPPSESSISLDCIMPLPNYLDNANAALAVVEMMRERGWKSDITQFSDGYGWDFRRMDTSKWTHGSVRAKTIPLAICEAALRALNLWTE